MNGDQLEMKIRTRKDFASTVYVASATKMKQSSLKFIIILVIGLMLLVVGSIAASFWSSIFNWFLLRELTLTPTSTIYNLWKETPIPMHLKFYFFNLSNPDVFNDLSKNKPMLVEMGPYVFREIDYKINQVWNDNGTVTFQRRKVWYFDENLSKGKLTDKVTNLDPIVVTMGQLMKNKPIIIREIANKLIQAVNKGLTMTKTVGEVLFDGYKDELLIVAKKFNLTNIPFTKFAWFYDRNNSDTFDGTFNMLTGKNNIHEMGIVKEWNFQNKTNYYKDSCGVINGTNGDLWPPLMDNKTASIFVPDICTYVTLTYQNQSLYQSIEGSKFISDETMLDNGDIVKSRKCFCMNETTCEPSGVLDVSKCKYGAPAFISLPHFYLADSSYGRAVEGLKPLREKHETFVIIEPKSGVPLEVKAQLQLNLMVEPIDGMSIFKYVRKTYMPMLWFTQEATLTSDYVSQVKFLLILPKLGLITCIGISAIGILITFIGIFVYIRQKWQTEDNQILLVRDDTNPVDRINE
ncbi:PREDICTED: protein croquemort-like isoform X1 [Polistes dominula]|uniref:Protein croquemort-like isoform X1 n=2 Tax=Polistes dominula TaxID=743375 RepID=A0ABM1J6T9_POLDO|nr:PREDICTED: protein croquemort-like isoform X1 [Polistes dominula]